MHYLKKVLGALALQELNRLFDRFYRWQIQPNGPSIWDDIPHELHIAVPSEFRAFRPYEAAG